MPGKRPHGPSAPPDIKKTITRYYDDCMASGTAKKKGDPKEYCSRVAWQRFCMFKNPEHPSCTRYGKTRATMEGGRPMFQDLMRVIDEEHYHHHDGAVEREEFHTLPPIVDLTDEKRAELERFVLDELPVGHTFATAEGAQGIVYNDKRGRATTAVIREMDGSELMWLASRLGYGPEEHPVDVTPDFEETAPSLDDHLYAELLGIVGEARTPMMPTGSFNVPTPQARGFGTRGHGIPGRGGAVADESVALKYLRQMNQAYRKKGMQGVVVVAKAFIKEYRPEDSSMVLAGHARELAKELSLIARIKAPPWVSPSYIPGIQEELDDWEEMAIVEVARWKTRRSEIPKGFSRPVGHSTPSARRSLVTTDVAANVKRHVKAILAKVKRVPGAEVSKVEPFQFEVSFPSSKWPRWATRVQVNPLSAMYSPASLSSPAGQRAGTETAKVSVYRTSPYESFGDFEMAMGQSAQAAQFVIDALARASASQS